MKASKPSNPLQTLDEAWEALAQLETPELPTGMEERFWLKLGEELTVEETTPVQTSPPAPPRWLSFWQSFRLPAFVGTAAVAVLAGVWWWSASKSKNNSIVKPAVVAKVAPAKKEELKQISKRPDLYSHLALFENPEMLEMFENYKDIDKVSFAKKKGS